MPGKTVPLSVRVTDADAEFLARLDIAGATTPSEKLRALLTAERTRGEGAGDPHRSFEIIRDLLRPAQRGIRLAEAEQGISSDFVRKVYDRLPEIVAVALVGPGEGADRKVLTNFESRLLDQAFGLIQEVLELGLIAQGRCYDPAAITVRLQPVFELVDLIHLSQERRKGDK